MKKIAFSAIVLGMAIATCASASTDVSVYNRAVAGDITVQGGARRIHGNMAEMYQSEIELAQKQHAKNVILLIGDGTVNIIEVWSELRYTIAISLFSYLRNSHSSQLYQLERHHPHHLNHTSEFLKSFNFPTITHKLFH